MTRAKIPLDQPIEESERIKVVAFLHALAECLEAGEVVATEYYLCRMEPGFVEVKWRKP